MSLKERMAIYDICRKFELDHIPEVIICVDKGAGPHRWVINMGATGFSSDGKFSQEASRVVIFGKKDLKKQVEDVLTDMFDELYGTP